MACIAVIVIKKYIIQGVVMAKAKHGRMEAVMRVLGFGLDGLGLALVLLVGYLIGLLG